MTKHRDQWMADIWKQGMTSDSGPKGERSSGRNAPETPGNDKASGPMDGGHPEMRDGETSDSGPKDEGSSGKRSRDTQE